MTDDQFHAHRTTLANNFAAAGAELLEFMRAPGTLAAIPNTSPEQYVVAGDLVAIQALLPNRRERRGQRPKEELYFGAEAGQPRRWSTLITESGKGVVADYGHRFPVASAELERVDVVEVAAGAPAVGASTVLTDERIEAWDAVCDALREIDFQWIHKGKNGIDAAVKMIKRLAAQAGQVAVPEDVVRNAARYRWLMDNQWCVEWDAQFYDRTPHGPSWTVSDAIDAAIAASPSPAKESK